MNTSLKINLVNLLLLLLLIVPTICQGQPLPAGEPASSKTVECPPLYQCVLYMIHLKVDGNGKVIEPKMVDESKPQTQHGSPEEFESNDDATATDKCKKHAISVREELQKKGKLPSPKWIKYVIKKAVPESTDPGYEACSYNEWTELSSGLAEDASVQSPIIE